MHLVTLCAAVRNKARPFNFFTSDDMLFVRMTMLCSEIYSTFVLLHSVVALFVATLFLVSFSSLRLA